MKEKIIAILSDLRPEFDFTDESLNFIEEGMLDSFDVVCLVDALDTEFNIVIDDRDTLSHQTVHQRRLPDVRITDNINKAGFMLVFHYIPI